MCNATRPSVCAHEQGKDKWKLVEDLSDLSTLLAWNAKKTSAREVCEGAVRLAVQHLRRPGVGRSGDDASEVTLDDGRRVTVHTLMGLFGTGRVLGD